MTRSVAIYLFPEVEVLDFAGPFQVFTTASRVALRRNPRQPAPFGVVTVAKRIGPVRARGGLLVVPDFTLESVPPIDLLLIPGGVVDEEMRSESLIDWIRERSGQAAITASVCTGAFLLARAGLLAHRRATTHWEDIDTLREQFPDLRVEDGVRWVDGGRVVTSAGIAAGIDLSLHLVARLAGPELAVATARQMDVPYRGEA